MRGEYKAFALFAIFVGVVSVSLQFLEDHPEVAARAAATAGQVVVLELLGQFQIHHRLLRRLASLERCARVLEEEPVELAEVHQVLELHRHRRMPVDDDVDFPDSLGRFGDRLRVGDATATVVAIDERLTLVRKRITGVDDARVAEHTKASPLVCAGPK